MSRVTRCMRRAPATAVCNKILGLISLHDLPTSIWQFVHYLPPFHHEAFRRLLARFARVLTFSLTCIVYPMTAFSISSSMRERMSRTESKKLIALFSVLGQGCVTSTGKDVDEA